MPFMPDPSPTLLLVRQSRRASFRALTAERPSIIRVRAGRKVIRAAGGGVALGRDALGVAPARVPLAIENHPSANGPYEASVLLLDPKLLDRTEGMAPGDPFRAATDDRALAAFERAAAAVEDPLTPLPLRGHAVREVLLWLAEAGVGFGPARPPSFADRLRTLLAAAPDAPWRAAEAARALAVGEATLRRRLAAEGTAFGDVLADVRMTHALGLLQTTDAPVNAVALAVGYASPSRFAARFRERFGIAPSVIRGADRGAHPAPSD